MPRTEETLTPLALNRLLEWLDDGVDSNGERYLEMHRRLVSYFDRRNRFAADELADETLKRVAGTLEESGVILTRPPARYCYVVARFVLLEDIRRARRQVPFDELRSPVKERGRLPGSEDAMSSEEQRFVCLDDCLNELREEERELIVEYYGGASRQGAGHRQRMADRMGITKNALCIRATRIRETLTNCVARRSHAT